MGVFDADPMKSGGTANLETLITIAESRLPTVVAQSINQFASLTYSNLYPTFQTLRSLSVSVEADEVLAFESYLAISAATAGDLIYAIHYINGAVMNNVAPYVAPNSSGSAAGTSAVLYNKSIATDLSGSITFELKAANATAARNYHSAHQYLFVTRQKRRA